MSGLKRVCRSGQRTSGIIGNGKIAGIEEEDDQRTLHEGQAVAAFAKLIQDRAERLQDQDAVGDRQDQRDRKTDQRLNEQEMCIRDSR